MSVARIAHIVAPLILCCLGLSGCHQDKVLDQKLRTLIDQHQLNQPFQPDIAAPSPLLAELGGQLFFSPDLSIDGSVACASCHHPDHAGTDGIALPIGIGVEDASLVGQARIDGARAANPKDDLEGLIPRNSPSVFNAALYQKRLFWDGRVQYQATASNMKGKKVIAGFGAAQHNPSNYLQENLLQTQARMPLTSSFEMKGSKKPGRNSHEIEQDILLFLQAQPYWCKSFAKVFGLKPCDELITLPHLTRSLAAFQATLVFTDSPFQRYIDGDKAALTPEQKRGAIAFLTDKNEGGAGCINCHSGKIFSNESFYNINILPSGTGANQNGWDLGRHNVDKTAERFAFRVPTLLNAANTAPYFHNGLATTLENAIRFKQTAPGSEKPGQPIHLSGIDYTKIRDTIQQDFDRGTAKPRLPETLNEQQIGELAAFIRSLSDDCLSNAECLEGFKRDMIASPREQKAQRHNTASDNTTRSVQTAQPPTLTCRIPTTTEPKSQPIFSRHNLDIGLNHKRQIGVIKKGWLIDVVNYASVAAVDLNYDCLDDLVFDAGEHGLKVYYQTAEGAFQYKPVTVRLPEGAVNALPMDLDGDYRFDLFIGNYGAAPATLLFDFQSETRDAALLDTLTGPVINASIGDIDNDGSQDMILAMWRSFSSFKQPHIWMNDGHGNLSARNGFITLAQHAKHVGGNEQIKRQDTLGIGVSDLTFTPNLVDINEDGHQDLLLASDFFRSQVLKNENGRFIDITDKRVIDDTNGMGAAVGDFDNNGTMDWFVTSIVDTTANGLSRGHRLYMNQGDGVYAQSPIINKEVEWSWGACTADFDNDGHLDLFYISGYGEPLPNARYESTDQRAASNAFLEQLKRYGNTHPTLLINNGNGTFRDDSSSYGLSDPLDGRGIACFDYQQDGDIDIIVAPLEGKPVLLKNNQKQRHHWLGLRIIGPPGNTEALGTRVILKTNAGKQYRQIRFENNFVSRNPAQLHFGLGEADSVDWIEIHLPLPYGKTVRIPDPGTDQLHVYTWDTLMQLAKAVPDK